MSIEDSFGAAFLAQSTITAVTATLPFSNPAAPAITPMQGVEEFKNAFPRIVYTKTQDAPVYSDAGASSLSKAAFTIECQGTKIADAESLRNVVKTYLKTLGNGTSFGANKLMHCFITDEYDDPHPAIHGEEVGIRAKTFEVELSYT